MSTTGNNKDEELKLMQLQDILLAKDREKVKAIEEQLKLFRQKFPVEYEGAVNQLIEEKLEGSQEEILNIIYPVLGKMIKKFITHQFQMLKERIDQSIRKTFSTKGFWTKVKSRVFGVNESEIILSDLDKPVIEEVYAIQRDSGLLMGIGSKQETIDQDVIAGMLTAIKSFVEDAFKKETQDLEMIEYGNYKVFIHNFPTFYLAIAMSGSISALEKGALSDKIFDFADEVLSDRQELNETNFEYISTQLKQKFISDD